jgi:hypothetical protein
MLHQMTSTIYIIPFTRYANMRPPVDRPKELWTGCSSAHAHQTHTLTCATNTPSPTPSRPVPPLPGVYRRLPHPAPTRQYPQVPETRTVHAKQLDGLQEHAEDEKDSASVSGASSLSLAYAAIATALICGAAIFFAGPRTLQHLVRTFRHTCE